MVKSLLAIVISIVAIAPTHAATILALDFNGSNPWPSAATDVLPSTPLPIDPSIDLKPVGTVDTADSSDRTGGMLLSAQVGSVNSPWQAIFASGLMPVKNDERNLGKLTLAFDLSISVARPVTVRFESYNVAKKRTGGLTSTVIPAAPDFYQRSAIDLSEMTPGRRW